MNECSRPELNTCSPFAQCIDTTDGYFCSCMENFVDTSSQFGLLPGRKCSNASNEVSDYFNIFTNKGFNFSAYISHLILAMKMQIVLICLKVSVEQI